MAVTGCDGSDRLWCNLLVRLRSDVLLCVRIRCGYYSRDAVHGKRPSDKLRIKCYCNALMLNSLDMCCVLKLSWSLLSFVDREVCAQP
jgi:hypothetical protein